MVLRLTSAFGAVRTNPAGRCAGIDSSCESRCWAIWSASRRSFGLRSCWPRCSRAASFSSGACRSPSEPPATWCCEMRWAMRTGDRRRRRNRRSAWSRPARSRRWSSRYSRSASNRADWRKCWIALRPRTIGRSPRPPSDLAAVIEPVLIVMLALVVLFIVMATVLPILEAGNAIQ